MQYIESILVVSCSTVYLLPTIAILPGIHYMNWLCIHALVYLDVNLQTDPRMGPQYQQSFPRVASLKMVQIERVSVLPLPRSRNR
jgi:hypothetical protein